MSLPARDPTVPVTLTPDAERVTAACEALVLSYRPPVERDDDDGLRKVLAGLFRSRALDGQVKHGPMEFISEFRNSMRQKRQELFDAVWYDCMGEAMFDWLLAKVASLESEVERLRGESSREHLARECDDLRRALVDTTARLEAERVRSNEYLDMIYDMAPGGATAYATPEDACNETHAARIMTDAAIATLRARIAELEAELARIRPVFEAALAWQDAETDIAHVAAGLRLNRRVRAAIQEVPHD